MDKNKENKGDSFKTAIKIDSVPAEYEYLSQKYGMRNKDWRLERQKLRAKGEKHYDILDIILFSGSRMSIYFDITEFYDKY